MSSNMVDNILNALQEAKGAQDRVPQLETELWEIKREKERTADALAAREEAILRYKQEIEELQARVRKAEADRDDAEMRFLELDDKVQHTLGSLADLQANVSVAVKSLSPPPPPPVVVPETVNVTSNVPAEGQSASHPTASVTPIGEHHSATGSGSSEPAQSSERPNEAPRAEETSPHSGVSHQEPTPIHSDPEPSRYDSSGYTRQEWWDWNDRQMKRA